MAAPVIRGDGEDLQLAAARLAVEVILPEDLPAAAVAALVAGWDSPALRELAGIEAAGAVDSRPLFERALEELGVAMPTWREAAVCVAQDVSRRILAGATSPRAGARELRSVSVDVPELLGFVICEDEWDLLGERTLSEAIREAARDFLAAYPLPSDGSSPP